MGVKLLFYIQLKDNMDLSITVREALYRGDNLSKKITYLIPLKVGEIDILTASVYLNYIRADGTPDVILLNRENERYNESYFQYTLPVNCKMTKYAGEVCTWLHIFAGSSADPQVAKSGECILQIQDSKNMDDYIIDKNLTALYQLQQQMASGFEEVNDTIEAELADIEAELADKADNIIFNKADSTIQLTANGQPIGDCIYVSANGGEDGVGITNVEISENGELIITFTNGTIKNLGNVVGADGAVYVPHVSANKVLTFTVEEEPTEIPEPTDLNPADDWGSIDDEGSIKTDFIWDTI